MIDVIIPTKDRPVLLHNIITQIRGNIPGSRIIVVDASASPSPPLLHVEEYVHLPLSTMGAARQAGLERCINGRAAYIDDDIIFTPGWHSQMVRDMGDATVCSSRVIYGAPVEPTIEKVFRASVAGHFFSVASIVDVAKLKAAGGWDCGVHMAEDTELHHRLPEGQWVISAAEVWHPLSFRQWMGKAWQYSSGAVQLFKHKGMKDEWLGRRLAQKLSYPFVWGWKSRSLLAFLYIVAYRFVYLCGVARRALA